MTQATRRERRDSLPSNLPPRGLSRAEAAAYVGVGTSKFDEMVTDRRMPRPKRIDGRRVWDRLKLDSAFAALPNDAGAARQTKPTSGAGAPYDERANDQHQISPRLPGRGPARERATLLPAPPRRAEISAARDAGDSSVSGRIRRGNNDLCHYGGATIEHELVGRAGKERHMAVALRPILRVGRISPAREKHPARAPANPGDHVRRADRA